MVNGNKLLTWNKSISYYLCSHQNKFHNDIGTSFLQSADS